MEQSHDPLLPLLDAPLPDDQRKKAGRFRDLHLRGEEAYRTWGLPGPKTESWKYTNLNPLRRAHFTSEDSPPDTNPEALVRAAEIVDAYTLVMVNAQVRPDLCRPVPDGVHVHPLGNGAAIPDAMQKTIGNVLDLEGMPLAALNTAGFCDGLAITISAGTQLDRPLHIISVGQGDEDSVRIFHPRIFIDMGEDSQATIVESHTGRDAYFSNGVVEIRLAARARCGHYKVQNDSTDAFHIAATGVDVAQQAHYDSFVLQMGSSLARNEIRPRLTGENSETRLIGAYIAGETQHIDNSTFIDHAVASCASREIYKGVLKDSAHGVFQGKILVRPDAQKTDGYQINRALLLSDGAEINAKPELEIYADDVVCSHGATASQIDDEHLFYLRSRGLDTQTARALLIDSFLQEAVEEIRDPNVQSTISRIVRQKLKTPL